MLVGAPGCAHISFQFFFLTTHPVLFTSCNFFCSLGVCFRSLYNAQFVAHDTDFSSPLARIEVQEIRHDVWFPISVPKVRCIMSCVFFPYTCAMYTHCKEIIEKYSSSMVSSPISHMSVLMCTTTFIKLATEKHFLRALCT